MKQTVAVVFLHLLLTLGGCNALNKLTDGPVPHDQPNIAPQGFHSLAQSPQTTVTGQPLSAPVRIDAFYSQVWPWQIDDPRNMVPVYDQLQPSLTQVYAIWNYTPPVLTVEFINVPPQPTPPLPPFDVYVRSLPY